jgi:hypothetical protein
VAAMTMYIGRRGADEERRRDGMLMKADRG